MAGRMPGRRPGPPENDIGAVIQRVRMEAGLSRRVLGITPAVELAYRCPDKIMSGQADKVLSRLEIKAVELMNVSLGTLGRDELVIRALGRLLERATHGGS